MIRMSRVCALFACLVPLGLAAEVVAKQPEQEAGLRPIEPGVADVGPFGLSFRRLQRDMRQPTGFDRVYVLPPAAGAPGEPDKPRLARISGGLAAVFPRSEYVPIGRGLSLIAVPADTRFVVGGAAAIQTPPRTALAASPNVVTRAVKPASTAPVSRGATVAAARSVRAEVGQPAEPETGPVPVAPGMLTSEGYRVRRTGELLRAAADD